jgi:hypothetical protein
MRNLVIWNVVVAAVLGKVYESRRDLTRAVFTS